MVDWLGEGGLLVQVSARGGRGGMEAGAWVGVWVGEVTAPKSKQEHQHIETEHSKTLKKK